MLREKVDKSKKGDSAPKNNKSAVVQDLDSDTEETTGQLYKPKNGKKTKEKSENN